MRSWYYFTYCQRLVSSKHVHYLDICTWAMKDEYPVERSGSAVDRSDRSQYGNICDHSVSRLFNGARLFGYAAANAQRHQRTYPRSRGPVSSGYPHEADYPDTVGVDGRRLTSIKQNANCSQASAAANRSTTASTCQESLLAIMEPGWLLTQDRSSPGSKP